MFFSATVHFFKEMYLIKVKNICLALKYWECSTEEYYFALHWSFGSVQLKNITFSCIEVLGVFS